MNIFRKLFIKITIIAAVYFISAFAHDRIIENNNSSSPAVLNHPQQVIATETKFSKEVIEEDVDISFKTKYTDDNELEFGLEKIKQEGKPGRKKVVTTIIYYDGEEYERNVDEEIIEEPVDEVIARELKLFLKPWKLNMEV